MIVTRVRHMLLALLGLLLIGSPAAAAINCSISSSAVDTTYDPVAGAWAQAQLLVSCIRTDPVNDPTSMSYGVELDKVNNFASALAGGSTWKINYGAYLDSGCQTPWSGANRTLGGIIDFNVSPTRTHSFWICVDAGKQNSDLPGADYTDDLAMTLTYSGGTATTAAPITIRTPSTCRIATPPGTINFGTYSFGTALNASTLFEVTCTNLLPYQLGLDAPGALTSAGAIFGVTYTLSLSAGGGTGTGKKARFNINGTVAAGQPGNCTTGLCTGTNVHTLIVSY